MTVREPLFTPVVWCNFLCSWIYSVTETGWCAAPLGNRWWALCSFPFRYHSDSCVIDIQYWSPIGSGSQCVSLLSGEMQAWERGRCQNIFAIRPAINIDDCMPLLEQAKGYFVTHNDTCSPFFSCPELADLIGQISTRQLSDSDTMRDNPSSWNQFLGVFYPSKWRNFLLYIHTNIVSPTHSVSYMRATVGYKISWLVVVVPFRTLKQVASSVRHA